MARLFASASTQNLRPSVTPPDVPFTMACWYKQTGANGCMINIGVAGSANNAFSLQANLATIEARTVLSALAQSASSITPPGGVQAKWYHAVGVWASTASRQVYVDGAAGTVETTSRATSAPDSATIGSRADATSYFNGHLFWPAIWACALTHTEILALAQGADPRTIRPHSLWFFAELSDDTAYPNVISARTSPYPVGPAATMPGASRFYPPPFPAPTMALRTNFVQALSTLFPRIIFY